MEFPSVNYTQLSCQLPRINVLFNGRSIQALVDTGAAQNIIRSNLVNKDQAGTNIQTFTMACGTQQIISKGQILANLTIQEMVIPARFQIISELNEDIILGVPFLAEQKAIIDYTRKCMYLGDNTRSTVYFNQSTHIKQRSTLHSSVNIPEPHREDLQTLFEEFADLFSDTPTQATTVTTQHHIKLTKDKIINEKPYPLSPAKKKILNEQLQEMLKTGVVSPTTSPFSSPPIIVEREGKKPRFCVDFRKLNEITMDEASTLPKISDTIKELGKATVFTLLDLKAGYWQIPVAESSRKYTAFSTPDGASYQFNVMPFGLKTAPSTFQNLMARDVLTGFIHNFVQVYLDDIIIYSPNLKQHKIDLRMVFERLRTHNLKISPEKCKIATDELDYLGHHIKGQTIVPQEKHLIDIQDFPAPHTKRQLQSFLGTCNWVREYVPNAAQLTKPLTRLLQKGVKFSWTSECDEAFKKIKQQVSQPLQLHRPNFDRTFILQTDASYIGISAVLFQEDDDGNRQIVSHSSATLNRTETKYHINEIECLSIVTYVKKYRMFLQDKPFILRTDNRSLLWLNKNKDSKTKLTRWSLLLQEYQYSLQHVPGKENLLADYLSRHPAPNQERPEIDEERMFSPEQDQTLTQEIHAVTTSTLQQDIQQAQQRCRQIQENIQRWNQLLHNHHRTPEEQHLFEEYLVRDNLLWINHQGRQKVIVPVQQVEDTIAHFHDQEDAAHPGIDETFRAISRFYYWKNMRKDVTAYVNNCLTCKTIKTQQKQQKAPFQTHPQRTPFNTISIDVLGPYLKARSSRNKYIILVEDIFSKWLEAKALPAVKGKDIEKFLEENIVSRYGLPQTIISDNGGQFKSTQYTQWCARNNIEIKYTPPYHQQCNPVERRVQEFKKVQKMLMHNKPNNTWDKYLQKTLFILRNRQNAATQQTPSFTLLGYEMAKPGDWQLPQYSQERQGHTTITPTERHARALQNQQHYHAKYANPNVTPSVAFQPGQSVMYKVLRPRKDVFLPSWTGPYIIIEKISNELYKIRKNNKDIQCHVNDLRPAPPAKEIETETSSNEDEEDLRASSPSSKPIPNTLPIGNHTEYSSEEDSDTSECSTGRPITITTQAIVHRQDEVTDVDEEPPAEVQRLEVTQNTLHHYPTRTFLNTKFKKSKLS